LLGNANMKEVSSQEVCWGEFELYCNQVYAQRFGFRKWQSMEDNDKEKDANQ
jgi:hypothetical protein